MTNRDEMPTVLIVDDNHENIRILMETLKDDYKLIAATSGERALEMVASGQHLPQLILLDILMSGIDGYEVCRELKRSDLTRNIPVIFVTAISEVMDATKGFGLGAVDYITKPYHPPIVRARVQTHIKLKMKTDMLEQLASLDGLTNIPNRRKFNEMLKNEWERAHRHNHELSVIMADVDQFKQYNDHYGHATGDACLQNIAQTLKGCVKRPYDLLARFGGEEFVVILPEVNSSGAEKVGISMKQAVEDLHIVHEYSTVADHITISLGIATMKPQQDRNDHLEAVIAADKLLYQAKEMGRNRIMIKDFGVNREDAPTDP